MVTGNAGFDPIVDVRSGGCNGTNIACADATFGDGTETVVLSGLTVGATYLVRVYSFGSAANTNGTFNICVTAPPPAPSNDDCAGAISLTPGQTCMPTTGTTVEATQSLPAIVCTTADDDVWYQFTATSANHTVTVVGDANFDAVIDVRSGSCNGTNIACADFTFRGTETVALSGLTVGTTYLVRVYGFGSATSTNGTFNICVTTQAAGNDNCAGATPLTPGRTCSPIAGNTVGATQSLPPGACGDFSPTQANDVWYQFIAAAPTQVVTVDGAINMDAVVEVRSGSCNGTFITCRDATLSGATETITLTGLQTGATYLIRVYDFFASGGDFTICVTTPTPACLPAPVAPANGQTGICPGTPVTLSWPVEGAATSYDVYFGTAAMPPFVANVSDTTYAVGALPAGTYYWQIRPTNPSGTAQGCPVWTFTVGDNTLPMITCPAPVTLPAAAGLCTAVATFADATATDNCTNPPAIINLGLASGSPFPLGTTDVTFRATDASGNSATCSFAVTVNDTQAPVIQCPASVTLSTDPGLCTAVATFADATATDNCTNPPAIINLGLASGSPFPVGTTSVTFRATDASGNTATCSFAVTVNDTQAPVIQCPASVTLSTDPGLCTAVATFADATATDNCTNPPAIVNLGVASGSPFPLGTTNVTFRATDASGNSATCSFAVTVNDTQVPTITCPASFTLSTDPGLCTAVATFADATATDNCTNPPAIINLGLASGSPFPLGTTNVTFRATDASGNSATCSFAVTVNDTQAPTIQCPASFTLSTDPGLCTAVATFVNATATDNCTNPPAITNLGLASGSPFPLGTTNVTFRANDATGNSATCSFAVTVNDTQAPTITCPAPVTLPAAPGLCTAVATFANATATDNCTASPTIINLGLASGSPFPLGTTNVTFRATDASGNSATCSFAVTVNDTQAPTITCPAPVTLPAAPGLCTAVATFANATATDNCTNPPAIINLGLASGSPFPLGTTNVTFRATDASGNSATCSFAVTVNDTQLPLITCPAALNLPAATGLCTAVVTFANATATDNCTASPVVVNLGLPSGSSFPVGTTNVIFRATDASGNSATCSFTVTVNDGQPPVVACPAIIIVENDLGLCSAVVNFAATVTDNCGVVGTTYSIDPLSEFDLGFTPVAFTAMDAQGNTASCNFRVRVDLRAVEACNGLDDDCDGEVDEFEDFSYITKNLDVIGSAGDQYGYAVSVQGDYAIIGAPFARNVLASNQGRCTCCSVTSAVTTPGDRS